LNGANPFDYLTELQRHAAHARPSILGRRLCDVIDHRRQQRPITVSKRPV
jgi:hypothetical protein